MKKTVLRPYYFALLVLIISLIFVIEAVSAEHLDYIFGFVGYGGTFLNHDLKILGIPAYWFLMLLGVVINLGMIWSRRKAYGLSNVMALLIPLAFLIVSFVGGKILYLLENPGAKLEFNGLSLFGAIFFVPVVCMILSLIFRKRVGWILDLCAIQGLVLLSVVRFGCFVNGCCEASTIWMGHKPVILPVQLFEVAADLFILEACLSLERKHTKSGTLYPVLMLFYGFVRFVLQFLRKSTAAFGFLDLSSVFALVAMAAGVFMLYLQHKKHRN